MEGLRGEEDCEEVVALSISRLDGMIQISYDMTLVQSVFGLCIVGGERKIELCSS